MMNRASICPPPFLPDHHRVTLDPQDVCRGDFVEGVPAGAERPESGLVVDFWGDMLEVDCGQGVVQIRRCDVTEARGWRSAREALEEVTADA